MLSLLRVTDNEPILATASLNGGLALWDLDQRGRLLHLLPNAHDGAIASLEWIPGQPLLITSGGDNTIKVRLSLFSDAPHSHLALFFLFFLSNITLRPPPPNLPFSSLAQVTRRLPTSSDTMARMGRQSSLLDEIERFGLRASSGIRGVRSSVRVRSRPLLPPSLV